MKFLDVNLDHSVFGIWKSCETFLVILNVLTFGLYYVSKRIVSFFSLCKFYPLSRHVSLTTETSLLCTFLSKSLRAVF